MGFLDFLFEGSPPPSVSSYGQTVESMPQWYTDYTLGILNQANAFAGEGYQPYGGPRVAGFTPDQQQAQGMVRSNVGNYLPALNQASGLATSAGGLSPVQSASPYMEQAGQTFTGGNVTDYMNPYIENVVDRAGTLAGREFNENIMPGLESTFVRNGQFGSVAHQREADRAARDLAEGLQGQAQSALAAGYGQAGELFNADAGRSAQLAGLSGQLAGLEGNLKLGAADTLGNLGEAMQGLGLKDAAALESVGQSQQGVDQRNLDLAYSDFIAQRDHPKQQLDWLNSLVKGINVPKQTTTNEQAPLQGAEYGPSLIEGLGTLASLWKGWRESGEP